MSDYETTQEGDSYRSFGDGWGGGAGGGGEDQWGGDDYSAAGVTPWSPPAPTDSGRASASGRGSGGPSAWQAPQVQWGGAQQSDPYGILARHFAGQKQGGGGGGGGGGQYFDSRMAIPAPKFQALTAPTAPQFTAIPYAPPEEDPNVAKKVRREESAPGLRASRTAVNDAILASRNMENPNARGQVTRGALEGYGQNVEGTMARAGAAGRAEAARKRSEQLNLYNSKYQTMSQENMTNYTNKLNEMMMNWGEKQAGRNAEYGLQAGAFGKQPLAGQALSYNRGAESLYGNSRRAIYGI